MTHDMNRYQVYAHGGVRQAAQKVLQEQVKKDKEAMMSGKKLGQKAERMPLEEDEQCCICYDTMHEEQNLAHCGYGCGKNMHTECMERWVRHKLSNNQSISCPLCRTPLGENISQELQLIT